MSPSFLQLSFRHCKAAVRSPHSLLFSRLNSPTSQPVLMREVFHPLDHLCGPTLDALQQVCVSPVLRTPHLHAVLQVRPHQRRAEGQDHLLCPADHTAFDAAQDMVGFLGCESTLLAHVQLAIHQHPQIPFGRAVLQSCIPQLILVVGAAATWIF